MVTAAFIRELESYGRYKVYAKNPGISVYYRLDNYPQTMQEHQHVSEDTCRVLATMTAGSMNNWLDVLFGKI